MKGIILTQIKGRVGHGKFGAWLKEHFPKTQQTATKMMRLAAEFGKLEPTFQFAELTQQLVHTLAEAESSQIDLAHPLVARVAAWVGDRSAYQLELELGPSKRGGNTYDRAGGKGQRKGHTEDTAQQAAIDIWKPIFEALLREGLEEKSYAALPERGPVSQATGKGLLVELNRRWPKVEA